MLVCKPVPEHAQFQDQPPIHDKEDSYTLDQWLFPIRLQYATGHSWHEPIEYIMHIEQVILHLDKLNCKWDKW
ncbi:unnamed protein product [Schistosoma mattheei]|uniref:Uncharacterized protein n=1 Tax=Schistosoma mattheei TaxID=31246 RepID=A0A3P7YKC4_9TREM|nr:unnamed protein product [Schistosoma mattheei]